MSSKLKPSPDKDDAEELARQKLRETRFRYELVGSGISTALMLSAVVPALREQYSLGVVVLWGGAIGGVLASYERFERAGAILTRREDPLLNYLVGFGIPVLVLVIGYLLLRS